METKLESLLDSQEAHVTSFFKIWLRDLALPLTLFN